MSTQTTTYVLWGISLDYKAIDALGLFDDGDWHDLLGQYEDSAYKPATNPKNDCTVISDGMCGDYVMVGHVLAKSDESGIPLIRLDESGIPFWKAGIDLTLKELGLESVPHDEPAFYALTHYS